MGTTKLPRQRGSTTVLLVEDNAEVRAFASKVLRRFGYVVIEAANGNQALESIRGCGGQVDVLVSDIMMPGMRGTELARRFQLARPGAPVLLMSGYSPEPIPARPAAVTFLSKPFSAGQLLAAVDRTLSSSPQAFDPDPSPHDARSREQGLNENYWFSAQHTGAGTAIVRARAAAPGCSECDSLWTECFEALSEYLRILVERDAARKRHDYDTVEAFEEIENESLERCATARHAVSSHEVAHLWENVREDCGANVIEGVEAN